MLNEFEEWKAQSVDFKFVENEDGLLNILLDWEEERQKYMKESNVTKPVLSERMPDTDTIVDNILNNLNEDIEPLIKAAYGLGLRDGMKALIIV